MGPFYGRQDGAQTIPPMQARQVSCEWHTKSVARFWSDVPHAHNSASHYHNNFQQDANDAVFKEKIFRWAHSNYINLLAILQQKSRMNPYKMTNQTPQPKSKFYPKPPRQPKSDFSDSVQNRQALSQFDQSVLVSKYPHGQRLAVDDSEIRPTTAIYSPYRRPSLQGGVDTGQISNSGPILSFSERYMDRYRTVRRVPGPVRQPSYLDLAEQSTTKANAIAALEMIERLCEESHDHWVEGMLLAGCLAYALEDFIKAVHWYQKILTRDAVHVEAMSNLAASLLALNRREEALQYWVEAVRLRPSHFEAVEHLVALLSSTRRSRDAVATIDFVEKALQLQQPCEYIPRNEIVSESDSDSGSRTSSVATVESSDRAIFDFEDPTAQSPYDNTGLEAQPLGFGSSGYSVPASDNYRLLALIHAKGNMLYGLCEIQAAASAFEEAIMIATGRRRQGIKGLIRDLLAAFAFKGNGGFHVDRRSLSKDPVLLPPDEALKTRFLLFPHNGNLPGLAAVTDDHAHKAAIQTTSNSLLSLAKIYQDCLANSGTFGGPSATTGVRDVLALYYLSLSLLPSPSTANNVGILLTNVQQTVSQRQISDASGLSKQGMNIPGVIAGSGTHLALEYYTYGLNLDQTHAHLYTNLGSLLKDLGQLTTAIKMYETAVHYDSNFDIALANLANAVKDQGRVAEAIGFYRRAVGANPDFAEAVCGLATALNSVCGWQGRGGIYADSGERDRYHVDEHGMLVRAENSCGWLSRVVDIVGKQLRDGESWGRGALTPGTIETLVKELTLVDSFTRAQDHGKHAALREVLQSWSGRAWEGSRIVRLVERAVRRIGWQWYQDLYRHGRIYDEERYSRPSLPSSLSSPHAPTVLPFHTFTTPLSAKQIRQISQRNGLRISVSTLRQPWLPRTVYRPPRPPNPHLNVGYVSSDFNNHPLAHLMQSVFGLHNPSRVRAFCYATTASDKSVHRAQIEREAPVFYDASSWSIEKLVSQIVADNIHVLINLNGYTRGARNEVFAARPAPIHMSFMGFAGTLGAEWCDYIFADSISIPPSTLCPWRCNVDITDSLCPDALVEDMDEWVYSENIIFARASFFCCDHKQSAPDAARGPPPLHDPLRREQAWDDEQDRRWKLRKQYFPGLADNAVILGNFNQLYKIDPSTFRMYLRILDEVKNAILWLLRFPDLGEKNLLQFAREWASPEIASRVIFTDVAPKGEHILRASAVDLFLDTPECNAHTTAADVVWSGTPIVTWGRWEYKMCSRMAGSIVSSALPLGPEGDRARAELVVRSAEEYQGHAVALARGVKYECGRGRGRLMDIRRMLWEGRWTSRLFDTRRWVRDLEEAYWQAWSNWERGEGGDIWL